MSEQQPESPQGHPALQEVLSLLPEELHSLVLPKLQEMDKHSQQKVQGLQEQYTPYKSLVENKIDPSVIEQALFIANHLQSNPEDFITKAVENFGLQEQIKAQYGISDNEEEEEMFDPNEDDITKHPAFAELMNTVNSLNQTIQKQQQESESEKAQREMAEYLEGLKTDKGEFDELYVSALMANDVSAEDAITMYQDTIKKAVEAALAANGVTTPPVGQQSPTSQQPPVVMGAAGTAGSGTPNEPVKMGSLKDGDVMNMVEQMILQSQQQNQ